MDVSAKKDGRFGQNTLNSFTESDIICRGIHSINRLPDYDNLCPFSGHAKITEQLRIMTLRFIDNSSILNELHLPLN